MPPSKVNELAIGFYNARDFRTSNQLRELIASIHDLKLFADAYPKNWGWEDIILPSDIRNSINKLA